MEANIFDLSELHRAMPDCLGDRDREKGVGRGLVKRERERGGESEETDGERESVRKTERD